MSGMAHGARSNPREGIVFAVILIVVFVLTAVSIAISILIVTHQCSRFSRNWLHYAGRHWHLATRAA